jgi:methylated-DNA-[protein]-cysteine S-methyltransferase
MMIEKESFEEFIPQSIEKALNELYALTPEEEVTVEAMERLKLAIREIENSSIHYGCIKNTPIGIVFVALNNNGIVAINFGIDEKTFVRKVEKDTGQLVILKQDRIEGPGRQIQSYLLGKINQLDLPFDISLLTNFQQQVLLTTLKIPRGLVSTYGDIARKIGNPKAARAVGQVLGRNPVPLLIPCHRVIASNGKLGGYSGGGGLKTKRQLLELEGALLA